MYEDNKYQIKINWKNILFVVGIIVLTVIVMMLVMPKTNKDANFKQAFTTNLNIMKEAAKSYYTSGGNMPENIGESSTINLDSMINKKLVSDFVDKNNKSCNKTNSYAQITKTGTNEYVLKTQLACDTSSDYVLETITTSSTNNSNVASDSSKDTTEDTKKDDSINNNEDDDEDKLNPGESVDKDGNVIKTVKEYEFKKPIYDTKNTYRCEDGYKLDSSVNKCYKEVTGETIPATPIYFEDKKTVTDAKKNTTGGYDEKANPIKKVDKTETKCPAGYTEVNNTCVKYVEATVTPGTTTYTCDTANGYNYNEITKKCEKVITVAARRVETPTTTVSCKYSEDKLNGNTCSYSANKNEVCSCPSGTTEGWFGVCVRKTTTETCGCPNGTTKMPNGLCKRENNNQTCSCPSGTTEIAGGMCKSEGSKTPAQWDNGKDAGKSNYDRSGYTSTGKISCTRTTIAGKSVYSCISTDARCSSGSYDGNGYCTTGSGSVTNKVCNGGNSVSYENQTCSSKENTSYEAKVCNSGTPTCDKGGALSYDKTTCTYNATTTTTSNTTYTCDAGYNLDSSTNTCKKIDSVEPTKNTTETKYTCPAGYKQEGTTCYITAEKETTTTYKYSCPEGFTPSGEGENMTCTRHVDSSEEYYCEDKDATLDKENKTCTKVIKGEIKGYECPDSVNYIYDEGAHTCVKKTLECKDPIVDTEENVTYQYKWSTSESLDGWTRTGNEREKTIQSDALVK